MVYGVLNLFPSIEMMNIILIIADYIWTSIYTLTIEFYLFYSQA
jgi:hypothetical protein